MSGKKYYIKKSVKYNKMCWKKLIHFGMFCSVKKLTKAVLNMTYFHCLIPTLLHGRK